MPNLIELAEQTSLRDHQFNFTVGDTVDVHTRILEGDKERIQIFSGVVIAMRGSGIREIILRDNEGRGCGKRSNIYS